MGAGVSTSASATRVNTSGASMSASVTNTKGFSNPAGHNNCFLNSAVQVSDIRLYKCIFVYIIDLYNYIRL